MIFWKIMYLDVYTWTLTSCNSKNMSSRKNSYWIKIIGNWILWRIGNNHFCRRTNRSRDYNYHFTSVHFYIINFYIYTLSHPTVGLKFDTAIRRIRVVENPIWATQNVYVNKWDAGIFKWFYSISNLFYLPNKTFFVIIRKIVNHFIGITKANFFLSPFYWKSL